ncbi:DUF2075 domain-containing protein [Halobacteriovorax sp. GB3]|uniref:DNA/RNA helicase domain-containing protein n=1 Tax=Halobacteriovorax sp. GB3 TaxID=2719615 RepID=UPI00235FD4BF|nr:DNA/RNA helicase domain-containing protein [Halobacteriovorax sp. GB3]MDD0851612.1 DUF2075 domain-containing protein [Halobacteriovorax sp. GB3]
MDSKIATEIKFEIIEDKFPLLEKSIKEYEKHCVTYLIHNDKHLYIGETSNFRKRVSDHSKNTEKRKKNLIRAKIITSDFFNKSAIYDIESKLINYMFADNKFEIINTKLNQNSHEYYMKKEINESLFRNIWNQLKEKKLVNNELIDLENTDLFKLSPFKEFSDQQMDIINSVVNLITEECQSNEEIISFDGSIVKKRKLKETEESILISGGPGTGKSLLIIKIVHLLLKKYMLEDAKIAICVPQTSLQSTLKKMLREAKIKAKIIKPIDMSKDLNEKYDLIIVDEAHRLKRHFNKQTKDLKHLENGKYNELDFAIKKSKHLILMYDEKQTIRPADLNLNEVNPKNYKTFKLTQQFRVKKGANYLQFIQDLLQITNKKPNNKDLGDYELSVFDDLQSLHNEIKEKNKELGHCRMGSGYYVKWISKKDKTLYDFEIEGLKAQWNTKIPGWVQDPKSVNEIGCIHTLQGQDLNYAGIIIGDDIYLDTTDMKIKINKSKYFDKNGTPINGTDKENIELENYIKNIYYVLLTRGMLGTFVFIKDENLRHYLKDALKQK